MMAGRDPFYSGNLRERMLEATFRNQREAKKRDLDVDWLFVEWNPTDDLLSYSLSLCGFRCYVVSPEIHDSLVSPDLADTYKFMEGFAKNVGMRRAKNEWLVSTNADNVLGPAVWDFLAAGEFERGVLYQATRHDVPFEAFKLPYSKIRRRIVRTYTISDTRPFFAAGDFMFLSSKDNPGYDEAMNDANPQSDGHFCWNWLHLGNRIDKIGSVYKADHDMIMRQVRGESITHKGRKRSKILVDTPYENTSNWGLINYPERMEGDITWLVCP